jgi:hypothetical protein
MATTTLMGPGFLVYDILTMRYNYGNFKWLLRARIDYFSRYLQLTKLPEALPLSHA